jgi:hypothetical protein
MPDRIEQLYDRMASAHIDEDEVHAAIDELLDRARLLSPECEGHPDDGIHNGPAGETVYCDGTCQTNALARAMSDPDIDEKRVTILDALASLAGIEPEPTGPWYIVRYNVTREFGGREEGGWYYDWYADPQEVAKVSTSKEDAQRVCRAFNTDAQKEREIEGRAQGRFSVLGGSDDVYVTETTVGSRTTRNAPRYE